MPGRPPPGIPQPAGATDKSPAPVPAPRRRGPPPKPAPYKQHKDNRTNEITTFKSNLSVQPQMRPHPPVPTERKQNRVSLKGEPSDQFFQPKQQSQRPVEYATPIMPKVDLRPRLNTPSVPPDPDIVLSPQRKKPAGPRVAPLNISARPRLNTPLVPPEPGPALLSRQPRGGGGAKALTDGTGSSPLGTGPGLSNGNGVVEGSDRQEEYSYAVVKEEEEEEDAYAVINQKRKPSLDTTSPLHKATHPPTPTSPYHHKPTPPPTPTSPFHKAMSPPIPISSPSHKATPPPTPTSSFHEITPSPTPTPPPLPDRNYEYDETLLPASLPATPTSPDAIPNSQPDTEYSTTSHAKLKPRPNTTPPSSDGGYSVTSHLTSPPTVPVAPQQYSTLATPHEENLEYSKITEPPGTVQGYSEIAILPDTEYSEVPGPREFTQVPPVGEAPAPGMYSEVPAPSAGVGVEPEYEIVNVSQQAKPEKNLPKRPPRKPSRTHSSGDAGSSSSSSSGAGGGGGGGGDMGSSRKPTPPARRKASPLPPTKSTVSPPTIPAKPLATPSSVPTPKAPPPKPKPKRNAKLPPPPLSVHPVETENPTASKDEDLILSASKISPLVELDIDLMVRSRNSHSKSSVENVSAASVDETAIENGDVTAAKKSEYTNQDIAPSSIVDVSYTAPPLSPSEVFTLPQHAVPGPDNYCEMDIKDTSPLPPTVVGDDHAVAVHAHPDSRGYCDVNIGSPEHASSVAASAAEPEEPVETGCFEEEAGYTLVAFGDTPTNPHLAENKQPVPTPHGDQEISDASGVGDIPAQESPKLPLIASPSPAPAPPSPRPKPTKASSLEESHSRTPSYDTVGLEGSQEVSSDGGRSLESTGAEFNNSNATTPTTTDRKSLGRRRPPPPPPPCPSSQGPSSQDAPARDLLNSGFFTLPRSPNKGAKASNKQAKSSKPVVPKPFSERPAGPKQQPPLPVGLPPESPKGCGGGVLNQQPDNTNSPGLKKKFMGFLKKPEFRVSRRKKRQQKEVEKEKEKEVFTQSLSVASTTRSLPRNVHARQMSFDDLDDADDDDDDDVGGIYSTISNIGAKGVGVANSVEKTEVNVSCYSFLSCTYVLACACIHVHM